ncbi:DUF6134 family protein [Candidatus Methylopumilus turicensis]|uniref:Uncharacterized protein n=1 Tax=Candidatus Methylopumilus turicensis TaxID=1581680 RepID=A0A0B7ITX4_9PROT|nr:DUF6134 family protein [Candidatus Methylopumilus turicensis]CEN55674.1 conserved exported protein of unknown function [Candidatus Methylopumilus turicensis]
MTKLLISCFFLSMPFVAEAQSWNFDVSMDGKPIGTHQFVLSDKENNQQTLKSEAKFNIKILSISFFKYHHQANEVWENNCLKKLEAKTQENSKTTIVKGLQEKAIFKLSTPALAEINTECVMTFAYWNPKILQQKKLLNPQTGDYLNANISALGQETIVVKGQQVKAEHYKIDTAKFKIDIWYGQDDEWLALQSLTEDGRIDYALK